MARDALISEGFEVIGGFVSPANDNYAKPGLIPANDRVRMCQLAVASSEWIQVDEWESKQPEWPTTITVLDSFRQRLDDAGFGGLEIRLVAGGDLVKSFSVPDLWLEADQERIVGEYGLVIVERAGIDLSDYLLENPILFKHRVHFDLFRFLRNIYNFTQNKIHMVKQYISNDISSTKVRLFVSRGMSIKYLLPDSVIEYIKTSHLYQ